MGDRNDTQENEENLSPVGSGRVDVLFDEIEATIETLDGFSDELGNIRDRIKTNEGETSGHVRNRINQDADQLAEEAEEETERLREELQMLKRTV
ncbi:hypothetical protein [Haladaptatus halobius]|uniref:hypothetical protein n=1 Tax=Haladaptatus halobius TaxID=2884875 RepID=UPI001D09D8DB|nr:hypothetical protein [Haladaptatus halobius]